MLWLFASVATSTPAARIASSAVAGALKFHSFGIGVAASVIAVSRFTMAMSAADRTGAIPASRAFGSASSFSRMWVSKCTSPPNAKVTG